MTLCRYRSQLLTIVTTNSPYTKTPITALRGEPLQVRHRRVVTAFCFNHSCREHHAAHGIESSATMRGESISVNVANGPRAHFGRPKKIACPMTRLTESQHSG